MVLRHALLAAVISSIAATASAQTQTTPPTAPGQPPARAATKDMPAPVAADARKLIGRNVKNPAGETVGEIKSVYLTADGKVDSVMVGVGGFLGVGEREVRLAWKDLQVMDNGEKVVVNMTKDQLKAMAPYKYKDEAWRGQVFTERGPWKDDSRAAADTRAPATTTTTTADKRPVTATESTGDFNAQGDVSANAVIGAKIKNENKDTVGTVQDMYIDGSGNVKTVVVSVGGFLGVGSKDVAVKWSDVKQTRDGKSVVLMTNLSKDDLKAMPDYKYERRQPSQAATPGATPTTR
jgi:sporulation protein YlmC with PRC-barrel domain